MKYFAEEQGLALEEAKQLFLEYVKFLYLMQFSRAGLTPSDEVDQMWHFHMQNSKLYH